jgi:hypothetical protein
VQPGSRPGRRSCSARWPRTARTPAGSEWLVGFRDEAAGTLATLRDVERSDASEQFERDATAAKELRLRDERELEAG